MKKIVAFTIADNKNIEFARRLRNSLRKFHSEEELPLIVVTQDQVQAQNDPDFYYRATPKIASQLLKEYETVIKLDADQIIFGPLSYTWEGEFDVAVVQNSNPKDTKDYTVAVWDIDSLSYVNAGFVVMKSKKFVDHWNRLCHGPVFPHYQMREQDLLNIMVFYGDYNVKFLDQGPKWHGLISKKWEPEMILNEDYSDGFGEGPDRNERKIIPKLILPKNGVWPANEDKEIIVVHFAGGNNSAKGKYKIMFNEEVSKHIDWLISDEQKEKQKQK